MHGDLRPVHAYPRSLEGKILPSVERLQEAMEASGYEGLGVYLAIVARAQTDRPCTPTLLREFPDNFSGDIDKIVAALIDAGLIAWVPVAEEGGAA